jgi:hypothetical protein
MRYVVWLVSVLAAAACGSALTVSHHGPATAVPGQPVPAAAVHRLTAIVNRAVTVNDGHAVAWASAVVTTHAKALTSATPGDFVPNDEKTVVYLVTVKGHFVARAVSVPPGAHAPTGTYMSLVINAKTFAGLDFGLGTKPPPVAPASFGPVTYLKVQRARTELTASPGQIRASRPTANA